VARSSRAARVGGTIEMPTFLQDFRYAVRIM